MSKKIGKLERLELFNKGLGKCSICKKIKPLSEFGKNADIITGFHYKCKECANKCTIKTRVKTDKSFARYFAKNTIASHKNNKFKINVTEEYIVNLVNKIDYCPICGCKLLKEYGKGHSLNNVSIDRINNEKELNEQNIQVICRGCNITKLNRNMEEMYIYCSNFIEYYKKYINNNS